MNRATFDSKRWKLGAWQWDEKSEVYHLGGYMIWKDMEAWRIDPPFGARMVPPCVSLAEAQEKCEQEICEWLLSAVVEAGDSGTDSTREKLESCKKRCDGLLLALKQSTGMPRQQGQDGNYKVYAGSFPVREGLSQKSAVWFAKGLEHASVSQNGNPWNPTVRVNGFVAWPEDRWGEIIEEDKA